jgi:hypothetical protein
VAPARRRARCRRVGILPPPAGRLDDTRQPADDHRGAGGERGAGTPRTDTGGPGASARTPARGTFRPLTALSLELDPAGPRGRRDGRPVNVALHLLNTVLLFSLLRRGDRPASVALSLALGWALLPRLTEAVAWSGGRADLLATTAVLTALVLLRSDGVVQRTVGAGALLLGLLAKEVALAGWVAAAGLALRHAPRGGRRLLGAAAPLAVTLAAYAALRVIAGATALPDGPPESVVARLGVSLEALGTYAWMALDPLRPAARIGLVAAPSLAMRVLGALVAAGAMAAGWALRRRARSLDTCVIAGLARPGHGLCPPLPLARTVPPIGSLPAARRPACAAPRSARTRTTALQLARRARSPPWRPRSREPLSDPTLLSDRARTTPILADPRALRRPLDPARDLASRT